MTSIYLLDYIDSQVRGDAVEAAHWHDYSSLLLGGFMIFVNHVLNPWRLSLECI